MKNIKVISVGGGSLNALNHMIDSGLSGEEFISCSTYEFYLNKSKSDKKIWLGKEMIQYFDSGSPSRSEQAAIESREEILEALRGSDAIIIVACLGGCDGTGASPIIAEYSKELDALTIAVVTLPYAFESPRRNARAEAALKKLSARADTVIKIRNDKILETVDKNTPMTMAFKCVDEVMSRTVRSLIDMFGTATKIKFSDSTPNVC